MDVVQQNPEQPIPLHPVNLQPPSPNWRHLPVVWRKPGIMDVLRLAAWGSAAAYVAGYIPPESATATAAAFVMAFWAVAEFCSACFRPVRR
ncbi:hypothetical protein [Streptomyces roseolus]|uniref:hypothetical protein n=1 Tax=Streptomyces roseolus TaxID=67358 RepID=UPI0037B300AA